MSLLAALYQLGVLATLFHWQQPAILAVLVLLTLVGSLGQSITGYLYKIVPFLIWHKRYGPLVGRQKVPLMRDIIHQRWAMLSLWLINVGLIGTALFALLYMGLAVTSCCRHNGRRVGISSNQHCWRTAGIMG